MPFNGSGTFQRVRNWVADATAGIKIRADYHDAEDDGIAAGLTNCITKDGQTTITQNIPFNSKRITGLADPVNPQDVSTKAYADTKLDAVRDAAKLIPPGAIMDFAMTTAPPEWLPCNGQAVSRTTFATLFTAIGTTWGVGDGSTTFNVPALQDRFRRGSGTNAGAVGTLQGDQNKTHTHALNITSGAVSADHTHHMDFMAQANDRSLDHLHGGVPLASAFTSGGFVNAPGLNYVQGTTTTGAADRALDHLHRITGDTGGISANHSHNVSGSTATGTADGAEVRPLSATVLTCIKT
jgi:microcystin-dependent protein